MPDEKFKFTAEDFWHLLERQGKRCALTNKELSPLNCEVELRDPNKAEGRFSIKNMYLVDKDLKFLCRHLPESAVVELCTAILEYRGKEYGITIRRLKK